MNPFWDRFGISASVICIVHCLLTPFLVVMAPFFGERLSHGWFHVLVSVLVVPVAIWALWNGYRRHHQTRVLWLGAVGIAFIALAFLSGNHDVTHEFSLMLVAGVFLAAAHYSNLRVCRKAH